MMRCAQPLTGKAGRVCQFYRSNLTFISLSLSLSLSLPPSLQRSTQDEQLIEAAINAGPPDGHMFIYDARTFSAATGNKMMVGVILSLSLSLSTDNLPQTLHL